MIVSKFDLRMYKHGTDLKWIWLFLWIMQVTQDGTEGADVSMDEPYALLGAPFMVQCQLRARSLVEIANRSFIYGDKDNNDLCVIPYQDWLYCDKRVPNPLPNHACGCYGKSKDGLEYVYNLFYYISSVTADLQDVQFTCKIGNKADNRKHLTVITFTTAPDAEMYMCRGGRITLNWKFDHVDPIIQVPWYQTEDHCDYSLKIFKPSSIHWRALPNNLATQLDLASYLYLSPSDFGRFAVDRHTRVNVTVGNYIPMLNIWNLTDQDSRVYEINLTFFKRTAASTEDNTLFKRSIGNMLQPYRVDKVVRQSYRRRVRGLSLSNRSARRTSSTASSTITKTTTSTTSKRTTAASTPTTKVPSTGTANVTSTSTTKVPSTGTANVTSTSTTKVPSTKMANVTLTSTTKVPSTYTTKVASTTTTRAPPTTTASTTTSTTKATTRLPPPTTNASDTPHAASVSTNMTTTQTTPAPILFDPFNFPLYLLSTTELFVTTPPSVSAVAHLDAHVSITGTIILSCTVERLDFYGNPAVNTTIWQDDKVIHTRQQISKTRFSLPVISGTNFSCGIEGRAMECIPPEDPRMKRPTILTTSLAAEKQVKAGIDLLVVLYAVEVSLCLLLMIWAVALMIDHIRVIMAIQKRKIIDVRDTLYHVKDNEEELEEEDEA